MTQPPQPSRPQSFPPRVTVVDSHTEGEPTRVIIDGWTLPSMNDMAAYRDLLQREHDHVRAAIVNEPRGHAAMVGALLTPAVSRDAAAGVVFFNNVGCLGMCGHGMIGVVRTLAHLGRLAAGSVMIDTPAGAVTAELGEDGRVTIRNVPAYAHALDVAVDVPGHGAVSGDVAYGGNWFFITHCERDLFEPRNVRMLTARAQAIQDALDAVGITGAGGARIDHVELSAPDDVADSINHVLCPGGEYDRSPCGTGTSAAMAVLHARGRLRAGQVWRQRSLAGGLFEGWLEETAHGLVPSIRGGAHITAETVLLFDAADPLRGGLPA